MNKVIKFLVASVPMILVAGCSLPNSGPSVGNINSDVSNSGVSIVKLTSAQVVQMANDAINQHKERVQSAINLMASSGINTDRLISKGDVISINLWTFSPWPGQETTGSSNAGPSKVDMGDFQVSSDGTVDLPYAHRISVSGLSYAKAQDAISRRYTGLGILQRPAVTVHPSETSMKEGDSGDDSILVTGQIGKPRDIAWSPGGMTIAKAITLAMGDGTTTLSQQDNEHSNNQSAISVNVSRGGHVIASIPMNDALERDIPLRPADHLIVRKEANVRVNVLGGGISKNGIYGYSDSPTIANVLASAQGLNSDTADAHNIFIFRNNGGHPILYEIDWTQGMSMFVAQQFPIQDQDIVYVPQSPWYSAQKVLSMILQLGIIASVAR